MSHATAASRQSDPALAHTLSPLAIFASVTDEMDQVEERIKLLFHSDADALTEISEYLLRLGGKRVRPLLALLSARLVGQGTASSALIDIGAGIELIHMATLLHDDIIDESPTRRRQISAFKRFGTASTLLTGDFLLVRAFGLCAHLGEFIVDATEEACVFLTEGEILEGQLGPSRRISIDDYLNIVGKKTASLFSLAAETGSHIAGARPETVAKMRKFGLETGTAFQIVDDILDIVADEDLLGKPVGTDLRQKTPSIVNVLWLQSGDPRAEEFFARETLSAEKCEEAAQFLRGSEIVERARTLARDHADRARTTLAEVGPEIRSPETFNQLNSLIEYTLNRCL